ncbi:hypothetical protein DPMN_191549 [Dreissena polymorpha]|uniref:Uncharacterized protein n=1 Tax=Dreissena polymorpha TaxID=45954 RepID=A0A9D4BEX2_DREPO|nr:hypothetical protein DPMN_191549 [Dreissena polymorpha]
MPENDTFTSVCTTEKAEVDYAVFNITVKVDKSEIMKVDKSEIMQSSSVRNLGAILV